MSRLMYVCVCALWPEAIYFVVMWGSSGLGTDSWDSVLLLVQQARGTLESNNRPVIQFPHLPKGQLENISGLPLNLQTLWQGEF